jgi:hypothetical protein
MTLGDIYINKENKSIIQIDSYASPMGDFLKGHIVVFRQLEEYGDVIGSMPSFNGYGSKEEIESEYELLISKEELNKYGGWNEIFELAKTH